MKKVLVSDNVHQILLENLKKLGYEVDYVPNISLSEVLNIIENYHGIIVNSKIICNKELLDKANKLQFIGRLGSGLEIIDLDYAKQKSVAVYNSPEGNCNAVAEHALGMLLSILNNLRQADREVRENIWEREKNRGFELDGKTIGIIGFGHTGKQFAKKLRGFDVEILAHDIVIESDPIQFGHVKHVSVEEIQNSADIISVHLPLTPETVHYIDKAFIDACKKPFILINTARGSNVKLKDLLDGLKSQKLMAACLDVFENEKPEKYSQEESILYAELHRLDQVILSPHVAGWTRESLRKIAETLSVKIKEGNHN